MFVWPKSSLWTLDISSGWFDVCIFIADAGTEQRYAVDKTWFVCQRFIVFHSVERSESYRRLWRLRKTSGGVYGLCLWCL
jgi:hypothetical protein